MENNSQTKEMKEAIVINWDNFDDLPDGEESLLDPESDAFEQIAPPPPGVYSFKLEFAPDNPQVKFTDKGKPYYSARLECSLISDDKDLDGGKVYPTVTTNIGRGKATSTMASLLLKGGGKLTSNTATDKQVMKDFKTWIMSEPIMDIEVDWQVGFQDSDKSWKTIYSSQSKIPKDKDGHIPFRFEFKTKDGSTVQTGAILVHKTFFSKDGKLHVSKTTNSQVASNAKDISSAPRRRQVVDDESVEDLEAQLATSSNGAKSKK